jgi:hypothetical protein
MLVATGGGDLTVGSDASLARHVDRYHVPMSRTRRCRWPRLAVRVAVVVASGLIGHSAGAWSNHALGTWPALSAMPELKAIAPVKVERLETFLVAEAAAIGELLRAEEQWARQNVPSYPPRPEALAFRSDRASPDELVRRFVAAVRINPQSRLALFVQLPPGQGASGRTTLRESDVTLLKSTESTKFNTFVAVSEGDLVPAIDVVATATDEPDYGLDIGLWEDNDTAHGKAYGFGRQPFGNPKVEFGSQAPLHIGFFHEPPIAYAAAPFLRRTLPEYRIHLWASLASHALRTGHPYWGWRFAGWALHYVQDLTQPYHARVLPGIGVASMLWINTIDLVGIHRPKIDAIGRVTNRHLALENYQLRWLRDAYLRNDREDAALKALGDTSRDARTSYASDVPRRLIARQASDAADAIDAALVARLPAKYTSDPEYVFGVTETGLDLYGEVAKSGPAARQAMAEAVAPLLANFGTYSRAFVRALLAGAR